MVDIRLLTSADIEPIAKAFAKLGWHKSASQYQRYLSEQEKGQRVVLVAKGDDVFTGYVTILWDSVYLPFREGGIPEIVDFNVLPRYRHRRIGTQLMDEAERWIAKRASFSGIGAVISRTDVGFLGIGNYVNMVIKSASTMIWLCISPSD